MSETRPWIGSHVSLAEFKLLRSLRPVNCADKGRALLHFSLSRELELKEREMVARGEISHAFSEPITPSDVTAEYAPTQILSDLFRHCGYDGIRYKSLLGPGFNYALFDLDSADLLNCQLQQVKKIAFEFKIAGNPYFNQTFYM